MDKTTIKYTVNLDTNPDDAKGYDIVESGSTKKPWKIDGTVDVDMGEYLETQDVHALAIRSATIDIQKDERSKVLDKLGLKTHKEPRVKTSEILARLHTALESGAIDQSTYDKLAKDYK